jgi:hypothetical protein
MHLTMRGSRHLVEAQPRVRLACPGGDETVSVTRTTGWPGTPWQPCTNCARPAHRSAGHRWGQHPPREPGGPRNDSRVLVEDVAGPRARAAPLMRPARYRTAGEVDSGNCAGHVEPDGLVLPNAHSLRGRAVRTRPVGTRRQGEAVLPTSVGARDSDNVAAVLLSGNGHARRPRGLLQHRCGIAPPSRCWASRHCDATEQRAHGGGSGRVRRCTAASARQGNQGRLAQEPAHEVRVTCWARLVRRVAPGP